MRSEALPDRWHGLLVRLRCIAQPQIVCKPSWRPGWWAPCWASLNQGDVWLSGHVTTRVLVKSLLTPINSIERMTLGSDKRSSGELPGHTVGPKRVFGDIARVELGDGLTSKEPHIVRYFSTNDFGTLSSRPLPPAPSP